MGYSLCSDDPEAREFFRAEYRHHLAQSMDGSIPHVRLTWKRGMSRTAQAPHRFHVHKVLARWSYRIEFDRDSVRIGAVGNRYAVPMVHHMMVHPSLRWLVSRHDALMLHGAAVVKNGRSLILTGKGGAGKTTTSSILLAEGGSDWQLHADDYVFVGSGPNTSSYMTRSHLYKDLMRWLPELRKKLSWYERMRLFFYGNLREWTREGIKWPVRLPSERLWPEHELADTADLRSVLLLRRADIASPRLRDVDSMDAVVEDLVDMNFFEARHFIRLVNTSPAGAPAVDWVDTWKDRERALLKRYLLQTKVQWLELPSVGGLDHRLSQQLLELLQGEVDGS